MVFKRDNTIDILEKKIVDKLLTKITTFFSSKLTLLDNRHPRHKILVEDAALDRFLVKNQPYVNTSSPFNNL